MKNHSYLFAVAALTIASVAGASSNLPFAELVGSGFAASSSAKSLNAMAVQTYADNYNTSVSHYLVGTSDPCGDCMGPSTCPPNATKIGRAAYAGTFEGSQGTNTFINNNGNDMVSIWVFDAGAIGKKAKNARLVCENVQNFTGISYTLVARVATLRGDNGSDVGVEGAFKNRGPFGIPAAGVLNTVINEGRSEASDNASGATAVAALGPLGVHEDPPGSGCIYFTNDRTVEVPLGDIDDALEAAQGVSYTACRFSCLGPLMRNVDCNPDQSAPDAGININNPLYIYLHAQRGGGDRGSERMQDDLTVDNILHLGGDCDFAGEPAPHTTTSCRLVWD